MRWSVAPSLLALCFVANSPARAQQASDPPQTLSTTTSLVVVPALVRTKAGQVVYSLRAEDFTLTDDGAPQVLHLEQDTGGEPLALVVVIEADAATRASGWRPYVRTAAPDRFQGVPAMIEAMAAGVQHQIAVVGFDSHPELELPFTASFDDVADTIRQLNHGNTGDHGAGILDALVFSVDLLRHAPAGYRRAILLLSETNDRGSTATLEDTLHAITQTNTAIYSAAFPTGRTAASEYGQRQLPTKQIPVRPTTQQQRILSALTYPNADPDAVVAHIVETTMLGIFLENPTPYPPGGCMGRDPDPPPNAVHENTASRLYNCLGQLAPPLALARMATIAATDGMRRNIPETVAHLTGGEYFPFTDAKTLEAALSTLANHLPNRYILTFQPQTPHPGLHLLTVQLNNHPGLDLTARTTYWADTAP